jgi:hypothetical protein
MEYLSQLTMLALWPVVIYASYKLIFINISKLDKTKD